MLPVIAWPRPHPWLHWVAIAPALWAQQGDRHDRWLAWAWGSLGMAGLFFWLVETTSRFGGLPLVLALGIWLGFSGVFGIALGLPLALTAPLRRALGLGWVLAAPLALVLVEALGRQVLLFPFAQGISQLTVQPLVQLAALTGMGGLSLLVWGVNCALAALLHRRDRRSAAVLVAWVAAVGAVWAVGSRRVAHIEAMLLEAPTTRVAQLQVDWSMDDRALRSSEEVVRRWVAQSERLSPGDAELVIWPEGAAERDPRRGPLRDWLIERATAGGEEWLIGATLRSGERWHNSIVHVSPDGTLAEAYAKQSLLPFGERWPWSLGWLAPWFPQLGWIEAGEAPTVVETSVGRVATPICYEGLQPALCRTFSQPELLVTVTNDGWFGDSAGPWLHAMVTAPRAVELGVPLVRSAYTGVSMVVEPHGRIREVRGPFTDVAAVVEVRRAQVPTVFARIGDWLSWLSAGMLAGAGLFVRRRRQRAQVLHAPAHHAPQ